MATSIFDEKTQIPDDSGLTLALGATKDLWASWTLTSLKIMGL